MSDKEKEEEKGAPFLPFDFTMRDNFHIYDNFEYCRNKDKTEEFPKMTSGKIIKNYEQKLSEEVREIKHQ